MAKLVETVIEDARWRAIGLDDIANLAATAALEYLGFEPNCFSISLLGCDDSRIVKLNTDFREKPSATNVLSWPSQTLKIREPGHRPEAPDVGSKDENGLGDIAIAYETCRKEAEAMGKPHDHHVFHLIVHGTLHLLGYDHISDQDAELMEEIERQVLARAGYPDPYRPS